MYLFFVCVSCECAWGLCSGTIWGMFRNVPRNSYREGEKRVDVWVSLVLHGQVRARAALDGVSMGDWVAEAVREKVMRDGSGAVGPGSGCAVVADERGPRLFAPGDGPDSVGVGVDHGRDSVLTGAERIAALVDAGLAAGLAAKRAVPAPAAALRLVPDDVDQWESDYVPSARNAQGRLLSPIMRDDWIDLP